jgi:hypothetical protein
MLSTRRGSNQATSVSSWPNNPRSREELGDKSSVTEVSKKSAEMWRNLPAEERAHRDDIAAKDKQRYMVEKSSYTGPWQVPWKRAKRRPVSTEASHVSISLLQ